MTDYYGYEFNELIKRFMPASLNAEQRGAFKEAMLDELHVGILNRDKSLLPPGRVKELEAKYPYEDTGLRGIPPGSPESSPIMSAGTLPPVYAMPSPITKLGDELHKAGEIEEDEFIKLQHLVQGIRDIAGKMVAQTREGKDREPDEPGAGPYPGRGGGGRGR